MPVGHLSPGEVPRQREAEVGTVQVWPSKHILKKNRIMVDILEQRNLFLVSQLRLVYIAYVEREVRQIDLSRLFGIQGHVWIRSSDGGSDSLRDINPCQWLPVAAAQRRMLVGWVEAWQRRVVY